MEYPSITFITPTLNASSVLEAELKSIRNQDYPQDKITIIIADGGSTDSTLKIAEKFNVKIIGNALKTAEAGKAAGINANITSDLVALIDSDNILPNKNWLKKMVEPFKDKDIVGSEPWAYTYRKEGGYIERYSALIGMNDPIVMFYGNYDRYNTLTERWTDVNLEQEDKDAWIKVKLEQGKDVPTIGANGTIYRRSFLSSNDIGDYLFDIDVLLSALSRNKELYFAKVKTGIIHTYCESDINKFITKQKRRITDYLYFSSRGERNQNWDVAIKSGPVIKFILYALLIFPPIYHSVKGYIRKPDIAWFFHPLAIWITLFVYTTTYLYSFISTKSINRDNWKQ